MTHSSEILKLYWKLTHQIDNKFNPRKEVMTVTIVKVRWFDGYLDEFNATEVSFEGELLWMQLAGGENRHIPTREVRWFSVVEVEVEVEVEHINWQL